MNMFIEVSFFLSRKVVDSPTARHLYVGMRSLPLDLIFGLS